MSIFKGTVTTYICFCFVRNLFAGNLFSGVVGCEHLTLAHAIEHFGGVVILNTRKGLSQLDLNRLPKLR